MRCCVSLQAHVVHNTVGLSTEKLEGKQCTMGRLKHLLGNTSPWVPSLKAIMPLQPCCICLIVSPISFHRERRRVEFRCEIGTGIHRLTMGLIPKWISVAQTSWLMFDIAFSDLLSNMLKIFAPLVRRDGIVYEHDKLWCNLLTVRQSDYRWLKFQSDFEFCWFRCVFNMY